MSYNFEFPENIVDRTLEYKYKALLVMLREDFTWMDTDTIMKYKPYVDDLKLLAIN